MCSHNCWSIQSLGCVKKKCTQTRGHWGAPLESAEWLASCEKVDGSCQKRFLKLLCLSPSAFAIFPPLQKQICFSACKVDWDNLSRIAVLLGVWPTLYRLKCTLHNLLFPTAREEKWAFLQCRLIGNEYLISFAVDNVIRGKEAFSMMLILDFWGGVINGALFQIRTIKQ